MDDFISRQAAVDTLKMDYTIIPYTKAREYVKATLDEIWNRLDKLPTAVSERPKGRWKRQLVDSGFSADWHCSECGWKTALEEHGYNFCPNCGADMREDT